MQQDSSGAHPTEEMGQGSFRPYLIGFLLSIILILATYFSVVEKIFSKGILTFTVIVLGVVQMIVQFVFFLRLGKESKPRWNMMVFLFMLLIVIVVVIGSLWIMSNLDYRVMDMDAMKLHEGM